MFWMFMRATSIFASLSWMSWNSPIGLPNATRRARVLDAQLEALLDDAERHRGDAGALHREGVLGAGARRECPRSRRSGAPCRRARPRGTARRSATSACPSCAAASTASRPGVPLSRMKLRILRRVAAPSAVVELADEDDGVGVGAVGDEGLVAVEHVAASPSRRARRLHGAEGVRARARLGDRPGADLLQRQQRQRPALLLRDGALRHDRRRRSGPTLTPIAVTMPGQ